MEISKSEGQMRFVYVSDGMRMVTYCRGGFRPGGDLERSDVQVAGVISDAHFDLLWRSALIVDRNGKATPDSDFRAWANKHFPGVDLDHEESMRSALVEWRSFSAADVPSAEDHAALTAHDAMGRRHYFAASGEGGRRVWLGRDEYGRLRQLTPGAKMPVGWWPEIAR